MAGRQPVQSDLVASLLESIDLGMADLISLEYEETVKQYKAKRKQEKENEPPSKKKRLSLTKRFHDPVSPNSQKKAAKGVLPANTQQSNNWAVIMWMLSQDSKSPEDPVSEDLLFCSDATILCKWLCNISFNF